LETSENLDINEYLADTLETVPLDKVDKKRKNKNLSNMKGLSKDEPIIENNKGGKQSKCNYGFSCFPPKAMFKLAEVFAYGRDKYAKDNWRLISSEEHFDHMMTHLFAYMDGDKQDDHLGHFLCRAVMYVEMCIQEEV